MQGETTESEADSYSPDQPSYQEIKFDEGNDPGYTKMNREPFPFKCELPLSSGTFNNTQEVCETIQGLFLNEKTFIKCYEFTQDYLTTEKSTESNHYQLTLGDF